MKFKVRYYAAYECEATVDADSADDAEDKVYEGNISPDFAPVFVEVEDIIEIEEV